MAITHSSRGFALLISVIFMSVMLAIGVAFAALGYKQIVLSSSSAASTQAFYAANGVLECALYADRKSDLFNYTNYDSSSPPILTCDGHSANVISGIKDSSKLTLVERVDLDSGNACAEVTVQKPAIPTSRTYIYSQGYSAPCTAVGNPSSGVRIVARGIYATY